MAEWLRPLQIIYRSLTRFEFDQGCEILTCEEAIQLPCGRWVVLLVCLNYCPEGHLGFCPGAYRAENTAQLRQFDLCLKYCTGGISRSSPPIKVIISFYETLHPIHNQYKCTLIQLPTTLLWRFSQFITFEYFLQNFWLKLLLSIIIERLWPDSVRSYRRSFKEEG